MTYSKADMLKISILSFILAILLALEILLIMSNNQTILWASTVAKTECGKYNSKTGQFQFIIKEKQ